MSRDGHGAMADFSPDTLRDLSTESPPPAALRAAQAHPAAPHWLAARRLWQAGGVDNTEALLAHRLHPATPLAGDPDLAHIVCTRHAA